MLPIQYPKELLTALDVLAVELWGPPGPPRGDAAGTDPALRLRRRPERPRLPRLRRRRRGGRGPLPAHLRLDPAARDARGGPRRVGKPALTFLHPKGLERPERARVPRRGAPGARGEARGGRGPPARAGAARGGGPRCTARSTHAAPRCSTAGRASTIATASSTRCSGAASGSGPRTTSPSCAPRGRALGAGAPRRRRAGARDGLRPGAGRHPGDPERAPARTSRPTTTPRWAGGWSPRGRRAAGDPWDALVERYAAPPCPTRATDQGAPDAAPRGAAGAARRARRVVHVVKFCEPELFDVPGHPRGVRAARGPGPPPRGRAGAAALGPDRHAHRGVRRAARRRGGRVILRRVQYEAAARAVGPFLAALDGWQRRRRRGRAPRGEPVRPAARVAPRSSRSS